MDSTEQLGTDSTLEQPNAGNSDEGTNQSQQLDNGNTQDETISKSEYKKLQAEYTKSRQELSEFKKTSELSDEDKAAIDFIKKNWFVTQTDLDNMSKRQAQEANLNDIIATNPDLKPFEAAIKKIWVAENMAFEDVIQNYWFKSGDKLARARSQWDVRWTPEAKAKSIWEMSAAEYAKYKAKMWWGENRWSFS